MFPYNLVKGRSFFVLFLFASLVFGGCSKSGGNNGLLALLLGGKKAPGISSVTPDIDSAGISVTTTIQVRFTKDMDGGSITNTSFSVKDSDDYIVAGESPVYADRVATFTPTSPLANLKTYTVTLTTAIVDKKGKPLQNEYSWSFTTFSLGQVPAPEFSFGPDTYDSAQTVGLSCYDKAADIYYTINGDDPNGVSRLHYEGTPINVDHNMRVRAMAERAGYDDSETAGGDYYIQAPKPSFSPEVGEHNHDIDVTLSVTDGATIYYTTGSGDPDTEYTGSAIEVHGDGAAETIRAWAVKDGLDHSDIVETSYSVNYSTAAAPSFTPEGATFDGSQTVTLHTNTDGATIRYTTDGSDPKDTENLNIHDVVHEGTVEITENTTINAYAFMDGMKSSDTTTDGYFVRVASPEASETTGIHDHDLAIHLTAVTGATIYYTLGTGDPDIEYDDASPILIAGDNAAETIRAKAVKTNMEESGVVSFSYEVQYGTSETPVFEPDGDTYTTTQNVTITSTAGSTIRYTTDGSDPKRTGCDTCTDAPSPASVEVDNTVTIRAYAYMTMMLDSAEAQEHYLIAPTLIHVCPVSGDNNYTISIDDLAGTNFKTGAEVRLRKSGQSDIVATGVVITGTSQISCTLDINGAAIGRWDLVVTNPDTGTATLTNGFRIYSIPRVGLVGEWLYNGNANDTSGNNYHATLTNGPVYTTDRLGNESGAVQFDGSDDYALAGDPVPVALQVQNEITMTAWIYVSSIASGSMGLIAGSQYDGNISGASIFVDGRTNSDGQICPEGHIHFQIGNGSWHVTNANAKVPLGQWVFIAATRKAGENGCIYYNGVLQPSTSAAWSPGTITYTNAMFAMGKQKDQGRYFSGKMDDVRVYNRALTQSEIFTLMVEGGPLQGPGGITATKGTYADRVTIAWNAVDDATGYDVYRDTMASGSFSTKLNSETITGTSWEDTTVVSNTVYFYSLRAKNACQTSDMTQYPPAGWIGTPPFHDTNLMFEMLFNGDASDTSGNNNHGVVMGAVPTTDRFGVADRAYSFDGVNDRIISIMNAGLGTGAVTLSAWACETDIPTGFEALFSTGQNSSGNLFDVGTRHDSADPIFYVSQWGDSLSPVPLVEAEKWVHLAVVHEGSGQFRFYHNGSLSNSKVMLFNLIDTKIGVGATVGGASFWHGKIDDIRVYNRALSAGEVSALYTEGGWTGY